MCSNVIDLSAVTAGASVQCSTGAAAAVSPIHVSHDCTSTTPIYEHCGPPTSSLSPATTAAAAAERPVPRPRSTYGKYHLENLKNINTESKPACNLNASDDDDNDDDDDDDSFCQ